MQGFPFEALFVFMVHTNCNLPAQCESKLVPCLYYYTDSTKECRIVSLRGSEETKQSLCYLAG